MGAMWVRELGPGLWRWEVPHPEWDDDGDWDQMVGCVYLETPEAVVLVDPLLPGDAEDLARFWRAFDRDLGRHGGPLVVLLTCRWHARSAADVRRRHPEAAVWAPARDGEGLGGLVTDVLGDGVIVAGGVLPLVTGSPAPNEEAVLVLPAQRAVVVGDVLLGDRAGGLRVAPAAWYSNSDEERDWFANRMRPSLRRLLGRDIDLVLPAHGDPILRDGRRALADALSR